ncbi:MAG: hypothetical protein FJZ80_06260 [Bacteroidetes bacterium]|nr:hypothetical protein [Bacteroidota bacterium]
MKPIVVVRNKIVKNDWVLNMRFKIAVKIKQANTVMIIHIIPNASPERNIPPGTFVNRIIRVVKSPTERMPVNMVAVRLVIIAGNVLRAGARSPVLRLRQGYGDCTLLCVVK